MSVAKQAVKSQAPSRGYYMTAVSIALFMITSSYAVNRLREIKLSDNYATCSLYNNQTVACTLFK